MERTTETPRTRDPEHGDVLGNRYRLEYALAEGGMGSVWVASHVRRGTRVALKVCNRTSASMDALEREIEVLRSIRRADVASLLDDGWTRDGLRFLTMELVHGTSLYELIRHRGPLAPARAMRILRRVARALDAVHSMGLVHRDIKPGNVLIGARDEVTLIDFGLAFRGVSLPTEERSFTVLGTPEYMAPEQVTGAECGVGQAADRYAFAALALETLTGRRPYGAEAVGALLVSIVETRPRLPSEVGWASRDLDRVFARAMARDPSRRFESARAFVSALSSAFGTSSIQSERDAATLAPTVSMPTARRYAA